MKIADAVKRRLRIELRGVRCLWLGSELAELLTGPLPAGCRRVSRPEHAELLAVLARQVSGTGEVLPLSPVTAGRLLAVVRAEVGRPAPASLPIVHHLALPSGALPSTHARACRVFSALGVLDVTREGLVIRELAPGVSATDLQQWAEPTLLIGPDAQAMADS